ncbi:peptide deformylase [Peptoanaerobacter stomatis]|jgi:peptide deformylase|uniref:Peptide deformylase n=2 Tax=Peptoanaerobacter stomatis TaxID=796937 RepID=J6H3G0_9FIRM|nr:peptide deformylase [Peptoanaerobacter stomatis]EHL16131.1 peptide deformylase [Peptoanaerobacter stomatis]EJU19915.1 peptide deformylase [Peptoanaerobacter stomatis]NWO25034.1 peptide deformylase [Peptostreptococcaceae bacterium oral taxon 081]
MAIRNLRIEGDPILRKTSRVVEELNENIINLIEDMKETMYLNEGVGLAAPQVGVLKRVVVVDVGDVDEDDEQLGKGEDIPDGAIVLINPEIIKQDGEQVGLEGCLSVPERSGEVKRPSHIIVKAKNENFEDVEFEARNFFARAICHEIDHLNGILYIDKLENTQE